MDHEKRAAVIRARGRALAAAGLGLLALAVVGARGAHADGDDYFFDSNGRPRETELTFFGSVKDQDRGFIKGAVVHAEVPFEMESGPRHLGFDSVTNELGRYRTRNLGRTIIGLGYDIDPQAVVLTVKKQGYHLVRREYRSKRTEMRLIEVNFFMAKDDPATGCGAACQNAKESGR